MVAPVSESPLVAPVLTEISGIGKYFILPQIGNVRDRQLGEPKLLDPMACPFKKQSKNPSRQSLVREKMQNRALVPTAGSASRNQYRQTREQADSPHTRSAAGQNVILIQNFSHLEIPPRAR